MFEAQIIVWFSLVSNNSRCWGDKMRQENNIYRLKKLLVFDDDE